MSRGSATAAAVAAAALVAVGGLAAPWGGMPAAAQDAEGESSPVAADEAIGDDRVVVADGHVDVGPRFVEGDFTLLVRDDTVDPSVWRRLPDVVLQTTDAATVQVPDDPTFAFLGQPGAQVWLLPQVQQPGIVWPGWNTQDPQVATTLNREVTWTLTGADGPGAFVLFVNQAFGEPATIFDSRDPYPQHTSIEVNTHAHGNWVFTAPGIYRLDMEMSATTLDGHDVTASGSLQVAVGDTTDPQQGFTTTGESPATTEGDDPPDSGTEDEEGASVLWPALGALAVLLVVLGAVLVARRAAPRGQER